MRFSYNLCMVSLPLLLRLSLSLVLIIIKEGHQTILVVGLVVEEEDVGADVLLIVKCAV